LTVRWLFDLGNTRLKYAPLGADGQLGELIALPWRDSDIAAMLSDTSIGGDAAYVSSVASSEVSVALLDALTQRFKRISIARTQHAFAGVRIAYDNPAALGVDRFLALIGAHARGSGAALIVSVGTALTIDLLDADGRHHGGRIAPAPALMREALHRRAAQLPPIGGTYREFADDTTAALASGCEGAAVALIERSVTAAQTAIGVTPAVLLHGGGARELLPHLPHGEFVPTLVLEGLAEWAAAEHVE